MPNIFYPKNKNMKFSSFCSLQTTKVELAPACRDQFLYKPITTLGRLLSNVKDKDRPEDRRSSTVYKIKCCDYQATYIGETGGNLSMRLTEHKRATRKGDVNNHIAEHHLLTKHQIDWESATCITYSRDYYKRLTFESWYY